MCVVIEDTLTDLLVGVTVLAGMSQDRSGPAALSVATML
jgi:hypothetical protein